MHPTARAATAPALLPLLLALAAALGAGCGDAPAPAGTATTPAAADAEPVAPERAETPVAAAPAAEVLSDQWYEVRQDSRKTGWYHMVWTRSTHEGAPSIHDHTEHVSATMRVMAGMTDLFESRSVTDLERAEDGALLHLRVETEIGDRKEVSETRREPGGYVRVEKVAGLTETRRVATTDPVPVDTEAFLAPRARAGELREGLELTYSTTNFLAERLDTVRLVVEARESVATPAGQAECWRVRESVDGRPGDSTWWIDERGVLARVRQGNVLVERTTERKARALDPWAAAFEITLAADPELPRATSFDRCVVDVSIDRAEGLDLPDFPETPFSRVLSRDGDTFRLELTAHDDERATVRLPVEDPALARHLEATNLYAPRHPAVRRALAQALEDLPATERSDGRAVARAILAWIFRTLEKGSGPIPSPTAVEILQAEGGDCSEHAVLFVALCRSAGLPARRLSGYAQVADMWGAHSFCEIWLGKWGGADPTTNELGTRARYLCFGWDEDPESYPGLVSQRCQGRMRIRTVEFSDAGETLSVERAAERKPLREDLSGLAFAEPPAGWRVRIGPGSGTAIVTGSESGATIHVSAGRGDLDVPMLREDFGGGDATTFAERPALRTERGIFGRGTVTYAVPWRRRTLLVSLSVGGSDDEAAVLAQVERVMAPMFADPAVR